MKIQAKMDLLEMFSELMPEGRPNFLGVVKYAPIRELIKQRSKKEMLVILSLLVKDFCASMNVVRNMNEEQMIEAAALLLDECSNFRLEDYVMMFQLAKRGELVKIYDRIDLQIITAMMDEYWKKRKEAGEKGLDEESKHLDSLGNPQRTSAPELIWSDEKKTYIPVNSVPQAFEKLLNAFEPMKQMVTEVIGDRDERNRLRQIELEDTEKIKELSRKYDEEHPKE